MNISKYVFAAAASVVGLVILLVLAGCSDSTVVADEASKSSIESPSPVASKRAKSPKMVPFKGRWDAQPDPEAQLIPCLSPGGDTTEVALPSAFIAQGQVTHLGRTNTVISGDRCWYDADEGTITAEGTAVHTGANGDALIAEYRNVTSVVDGTFGSESIRFVDGTGRFEGASGYASSQGTIDLTSFTASFTIEGMVSTVGSNK